MHDADFVFHLAEEGRIKEAFDLAYAALEVNPDDYMMLQNMAYCFMRAEKFAMGYHLLCYLLTVRGSVPEALNNKGMCANSLASSSGNEKWLDIAEDALRKAIKRADKTKSPEKIYNNLAHCMVVKGEIQQGESFAREALKRNPDCAESKETLGYALLAQGRWEEGFRNYEFNLGNKFRQPRAFGDEPYYEGLRGGSLLVRGEQGIGDEITFASVLPDAAKHNKITLECDSRLAGLFRRSFPGMTVHGTRFQKERGWDGEFDAHCLSGSLSKYYRRKDEDFPRSAFLVADPERRTQWRALLDTLPGKKVGIAWTGGLPNTFKSRRSFNLESLLPILKTPGITWVSLQYKDPTKEIAEFTAKHGIEIKHWSRATENCDYDETAALVAELDSVVSTTTAVVHLCGGLGKECKVLVPKRTRWFYCSDSPKHRWYDSLELFRQQDKWPIERLADRLKNGP